MAEKLPESINLLTPVNPPEDVWERIYEWLFSVGKYVLVTVELVVLIVFFSRFLIDRKNNDLTDEINAQVDTLSTDFFRNGEIRYNNLHALIEDLDQVSENQVINSRLIASVIDSIPSTVTLGKYSFNRNRVSMSFTSNSFENIQKYESQLRNNPAYTDVRINLSKTGDVSSDIDFNVSFLIDPVKLN